MASYQVLEVTLISAKDLKRVTLLSKMRVYAVASISGGDPRLPTHRTYADREGGRNPMWQAPLRFTLPPAPDAGDPSGLALHVLLRAERAFGDRDVGEVFVPVRDLAAAAPQGGEQQRHLSYQVRRPVSGRKRGVLHISYRLADLPPPPPPEAAPCVHHGGQYAHDAAAAKHKGGGSASAVTAYPVAGRRSGGASGPFPLYQHAAGGYVPPYGGGAFPHHHHHQQHYSGYAGAYGYGQGGAAAAGRPGGGVGAGLGLGLLGGAVGGLMIGDMIADAEVDGGFMDGVGF